MARSMIHLCASKPQASAREGASSAAAITVNITSFRIVRL
jgi:hypothetical protein